MTQIRSKGVRRPIAAWLQLDAATFEARLTQERPVFSPKEVRDVTREHIAHVLINPKQSLQKAERTNQLVVWSCAMAQANARWGMAAALESNLHLPEALELYQELVDYFTSQEQWAYVTALTLNQMSVLSKLGEHFAALKLEASIRENCQKLGELGKQYLVQLENRAGQTNYRLGQLQDALGNYQRGRKLAEELENLLAIAMFDYNEGVIYLEQQSLEDAETLFLRSLNFNQTQGNDHEISRSQIMLGQVAFQRGLFGKATQHLSEARESFAKLDSVVEIAYCDLYHAQMLLTINLYNEAIEFAQQAWDRFHAHHLPLYEAQAIAIIGQAHLHLGNTQLGQQQLRSAVGLTSMLGSQGDTQRFLIMQAEAAWRDRDLAGLDVYFAQLESQPLLPLTTARVHLLYARKYIVLRVYEAARKRLQEAERLGRMLQMWEVEVRVLHLRGKIQLQVGELLAASENLTKAVEIIKEMRAVLTLDEYRLGFSSRYTELFADWLTLKQRTVGNDAVAMLVALEQLVPAALQCTASFEDEQLQTLRRRWHGLQTTLNAPRTPLSGSKALDKSYQLVIRQKIEKEILDIVWRKEANKVAIQTTQNLIFQLQQRLSTNDETYLQIYIADNAWHLLIVNANAHSIVHSTVPLAKVEEALKAWRFSLQMVAQNQPSTTSVQQVRTILHKFFQWFIEPIESQLRKRIYIALPIVWHDLPLEACYTGRQHFVEKYQCTYVGRVQTLLDSADVLCKLSQSAVILGHSNNGKLPNSAWETQDVAAQVGKVMTTTSLVDKDATEKAFLSAVKGANLIHCATHAHYRREHPLFSYIVLEDALLTVLDLKRIQFSSKPLIVLSACQTKQGKPIGQGVLGFSRILRMAGAGELILSRWRVQDSATHELMLAFYEAWCQGQTAARSLRFAQCQLIEKGIHPFYWAGFCNTFD